MKSADFKFVKEYVNRRSITIYGRVTYRNGKISIYLNSPKSFTMSERFQAKALAQEIVKSNFQHDAIIGEVKTDNAKLISLLTNKTQELKESYIERVISYAKNAFKASEDRLKMDFDTILQNEGLPFKSQRTGKGEVMVLDIAVMSKEQKKDYYYLINRRNSDLLLVKKGYEKFEKNEVKHAENHYENSLRKLSERLLVKGIDETKEINIISAKVGVNINMTIISSSTKVEAYTITAEGEIQRPHYRYLIK